MQYVNSVMDEINSLCSELYESLADKELDEANEIIKKFVVVLRDIQRSRNDEEQFKG
jgi:hypothetical protein